SGQLASPVTSRQLLGIPPVSLDPIACLRRHQAGRDHRTSYSQLRELPIQHVAGWTRLVAGSQILHGSEFVNQLSNRLQAIRNYAETSHLSGRFGDCHYDRLRVDIESNKEIGRATCRDIYL